MKQLTATQIAAWLPNRALNAHKGDFGRVLVVAGSRGMCGAGFLCAKSALVAGAGLVAWALPSSMQPAFAAALPEVITCPLAETPEGLLASQEELISFCSQFNPSILVFGPGMGASPLLISLTEQLQIPAVVDADGLNALARLNLSWPANRPAVFTPHPGEMARLLATGVAGNEQERAEQVRKLADKTGAVAVLKGHRSLVSCGAELFENTTGGPALAKAGSGDVLSGIIAGLWAQLGSANGYNNQTALRAALCGVYLHGLAGDLAARHQTDFSVLATGTIAHISQAIYSVLQEKK